MENISKQHIAKLVLGYLKDEKCKKAFRYLLECSPYLRGYLRKVKKGRPISTRINGLNLVDIISEYSAIYRIVQERLESTNYFNKTQGKSPLEEQLIYLLNRVQYSPPSSPCSFATRSSSEKDFSFIKFSGNICNDSSQREDNRIDCVDNKEIRTTLSSSLPGNVNRSTESTTSTTSARSAGMRHEDLEMAIELVSQKLLENREFHEKLAENINKEVITFCTSPNDEKPAPLNQELDNVIKTVLQKTEADPIFHKLLTDILDSVEVHNLEDSSQNDSPDDNNGLEKKKTSSQSPKDLIIACSDSDQSKKDPNAKVTATTSDFPNTSNINPQTQLLPSELISNTICIPKVPSSVPYTPAQASSTTHFINVPSTVPNCITIPAQPIILQSSQNQGYINTSSLLMVQQHNPSPTKSYQVLGGKPLVNIAPKWTPLNEQDIMSMPTVFISDSQHVIPSIASQSVITTTAKEPNKKPTAKKAPNKKIAPKTNNMPSLIDLPHSNTPSEQKKLKTLLPTPSASKDQIVPPKINITITTTTTTTSYEEPIDPKSNANQTNDPIATTPLTTDANSGKKPTPKSNSSHVRQLDFSTPEKAFPEEHEENNKAKETKEINTAVENVKTNDINSRTKSWDADLRALAGIQTNLSTKTPTRKRKRASSTTNSKSKSNTERKKKKKKESSSSSSSTYSEEAQETKKTAANDSIRSENDTKEVETDNKPIPEENKGEDPIHKIEPIEPKSEEQQEIVDVGMECAATLVNRHIKPTFKKKCNIDHSKRNLVVEKVVQCSATSFNTNKSSLEVIDDISPTLILSPTKLNANKRSIVEVDSKEEDLLETPDELHLSKAAPILNAKRNITPTLETPFKKGLLPPKTPHFLSPVNTSDTPFTKVLKEQLQGLDLSSFPTPKFPLTPDLAVTPLIHDQSPYSRRSTDYSTSSSYYQPSDTEQTKSIEQLLIKEGIRLENKLETPTKKGEENKTVITHFSKNDINERTSAFNNKLTGKKNLSLMKSSVEEKLHLTLSSSEDNCSSDDESSKVWIDNHTNDTVIQNKMPYSLRSRGTVTEIKNQEEISKNEPKTHDVSESVTSSKKMDLLQSLEEKRKSVIEKLKQDDLKREEENQRSSQKNKSKATGSKSVSKKKGANSDGAKKSNCIGQKKQTQSKINSSIEEEKSSNKQKKDVSDNPKNKVEDPKIESKLDAPEVQQVHGKNPQVTPCSSKDKVETVDLKGDKIEIESANDKSKKVSLKNKTEETTKTNIISSAAIEKIDDTSKIDALKKATSPSKPKNEKPNSLLENVSDISPKVLTSNPEAKEATVSVEKVEKTSLILREALTSNLRIKSRKGSNAKEESSGEDPQKTVSSIVKNKADLENTSKVENKGEKSDKIVVHSNVRILPDQLPDGSNKLASFQIQNDKKEEIKIKPHTTKENNQNTLMSNKLNNEETKWKEFQTKRRYRCSPVDEIVLHLSSDDSFGSSQDSFPSTNRKNKTSQPLEFTSRLLEPFELVQTELLEFNSESERCQIEDQLRKLHEENSTNDPEILLKELKERGIHLMPAKSSTKNILPDSNKNSKLNTAEAKKYTPTTQSKEVNKKEEVKTNNKNTKSSQIETGVKEKREKVKRNASIEEGEIISDLSDSECKVTKKRAKSSRTTNCSQSVLQSKDSKVETNKSRAEHKKRNNSTSSRDKEKGTANKPSSNKSSNKSIKEMKSSATKTVVEKSISNKVLSSSTKQSTTEKSNIETGLNKLKENSTNRKPLVTEQNISTEKDDINSYSLPFDTKVNDTETLHLVYDESRQSQKNKQYNLEILKKKISANVFIEEINSEVEKEMSFTTFTSTLDIPSSLNINVLLPRKKPKVEKANVSPLDKLYEKIVKNSSDRTSSFNSSPLDCLYSPVKTGSYNRKLEVTEHSRKLKTKVQEKQNKNSVDKVSNRKNVKDKLESSDGGRQNSAKKSVEIRELPDKEIEVIDGVISFNTAEKMASPDPNDELMNYAICGSVRIENDQTESSEKKRKASANVDETHDEKKVRTDNCQELLKKIDVDSFLKKVHGNA